MSCNYITGNNIYGDAVRESLLKLQQAGSEENAAYILMQRIFPANSRTYITRNGYCQKDQTISELGIFGAYLRYSACLHVRVTVPCFLKLAKRVTCMDCDYRNKDKVIVNGQSGYLMRTKVSSSDEGGVAAGFAVLDSVYLT